MDNATIQRLEKTKKYLNTINTNASTSKVINTLIKLQQYSKSKSGINLISSSGGVQILLSLLQRPNKKIIDISSSVIANCLTEDIVREEVLKINDGVSTILRVLRNILDPNVITRSCRSVANLASNRRAAEKLHSENVVSLLLNIARKTDYPSTCLASCLRALRHLSDNSRHRKKIIEHGCIPIVASALFSTDRDVKIIALRTLSTVSRTCTMEFADQILGKDITVVKELVDMANNQESLSCREEALTILINLTRQGCARPSIGNAGGIKCFISKIKEFLATDLTLNPTEYYPAIGALCYCCRDASNRVKLHNADAYPVIVDVLRESKLKKMHSFAIANLLHFIYHEDGLIALHDNGLFTVLSQHLLEYQKVVTPVAPSTPNNAISMWDGHTIEKGDELDERHSLTMDHSTKFNLRPSLINEIPVADDDDLPWQVQSIEEPFSPQWSPICGNGVRKFQNVDDKSVENMEDDFADMDSELLSSLIFEQPNIKRSNEIKEEVNTERKRSRSDQGHESTEDNLSSLCSRSFRDFINDTCNMSTESDVPTSTSSELKFSKKKKISEAKNIEPDPKTSTTELEVSVPMRRSLTGPANANDLSMKNPNNFEKPVHLDQIIIFLICHYCEVSDNCVTSLAHNEELSTALCHYIKNFPTLFLPKLHRIFDRLTSCPEAFMSIVNTTLVTSMSCALYLRCNKFPDDNVQRQLCSFKCGKLVNEISHYHSNNAILHNYALLQTSRYGSGELRKAIKHGCSADKARCAVAVIQIASWILPSNVNSYKGSKSMLETTLEHLRSIIKYGAFEALLEELQTVDVNSLLYSTFSYVLSQISVWSGKNKEKEIAQNKTDKSDLEPTCELSSKSKETPTNKTLIFDNNNDPTKKHEIAIHSSIVSEQSPVLSAMLRGNFRESRDSKVSIQEVNFEAAEFIIHKLYGCSEKSCLVLKRLSQKLFVPLCYKKFTNKDSSNIPLEITVLMALHIWDLNALESRFMEENIPKYRKHYITTELNKLGQNTPSIESYVDVPFLNFASKYLFSSLQQEYNFTLFCACTFDHNCLSQFVVIRKLFQTDLNQNILDYFKQLLLNLITSLQKM